MHRHLVRSPAQCYACIMVSYSKTLTGAIVLLYCQANLHFEANAQLGPIVKELGKRNAKKGKSAKRGKAATTTSNMRAISKGRITASNLNVRSCPATNCKVVETKKNQIVLIYERRGSWPRIGTGRSTKWVAEEFELDEVEKRLVCSSAKSTETEKKEAGCS